MTEHIFPEKRTRSQLSLPDEILQIPDRSPLKGARTALRNHTVAEAAPSSFKTPSEESDDELLLSPAKKLPMKKPSSNSKRSASPPLLDEYSHSSSSPPDRRELKRVKRDGLLVGNPEGDIDISKATFPSHQHLTPGHSRNQSEPNMLGRHSARKRPPTNRKKPASTLSASPPPTAFSPPPDPPKMGRAQSVPIFLNANDVPRIDFRNPPPSPKRRRSPSRSPSKERAPKLWITSAGSSGTPKLPTIHDDVVMDAAHLECENDKPREQGTRSILSEACSPALQDEIVPASPPLKEMVPASPPRTQTILPSPSSPRTSEVIPASPSPPPRSSAGTLIPLTTLTVPSTPTMQPLSNLISMSPLTPLPETPLPPRAITDSGVDDRYTKDTGWGPIPMKELKPSSPTPAMPASTSQIRRPATATHAAPTFKPSRPSTMGPPAIPTSKKPVAPARTKPPIDVFTHMMTASKEKGKGVQPIDKGKKPIRPQQHLILSKAEPSTKPVLKVKDRMRKKEKPEVQKKTLLVALPDEDEEEVVIETDSSWASKLEPETEASTSKAVVVSPKDAPSTGKSPEIHALSTEETAMVNDTPDTIFTEDQSGFDAKMVEDGAIQEPEDTGVLPPTTTPEAFGPAEKPEVFQPGPSAAVAIEDAPAQTVLTEKDEQPAEAPTSAAENQVAKSDTHKEVPSATIEPRPVSRAGKSKLPLVKKRQPVAIAQPVRVTRSASNRKVNPVAESSKAAIEARKKPAPRPVPAVNKLAAAIPAKKPISASNYVLPIETKEIENKEIPMDVSAEQEVLLPPGSPMRTTPRKSPPKALSTPGKSKGEQDLRIITEKLPSASTSTPTRSSPRLSASPSPSPTKIARSTLMAMRPTAASIARTFANAPNSSLSTLSNALEKLRMPPPARPNTSMGFNRDGATDDDNVPLPARSKDDVTVGRASIGIARAGSVGLQRSATVGSNSLKPQSSLGIASSSKAPTATGKTLVQKPLSMFMSGKGSGGIGTARRGGMPIGAGGVRRLGLANGKPIFGVGGGVRRTISKKSTLPVVIGSPVKGGGKTMDDSMKEYNEAATEECEEEEGGNVFNAIMNGGNGSATQIVESWLAEGSGKGKEKETRPVHSSRRVSMLSRDLTQSLSALPPAVPAAGPSTGARGQMGPPPTPPSGSRSARGAGSSPSSSPSQSGRAGTRSSARIAKIAPPAMKAKASNESEQSATEVPNPAVEALKVLKDCIIFVDVKTDDGDEAGTLFVEMLEGVGARVLTRVGQTCTHIVFKNGQMSTITRWKLLRDPKPLVVGIGWVVECIEQMKQVDEKDFLIDLTRTNVAGTHKRRRSMLPKLFGEEDTEKEKEESVDGDRSMEGSLSSITMDDDLTPLERARRRKSMLIGPRP